LRRIPDVTKKEKAQTALGEPVVDVDAPLSQLLLSVSHDKYRIISLATRWAKEIKNRDQSTLQPQELLAESLREILGKKVTLEEIEKLPPPPKVEKKDLDLVFPTITLKDMGGDGKDLAEGPAAAKE
jgi:DNA-directed RNA polymerase subunit K/omega